MSEKYICINRATKIYPNNVMALNNISLEFEKNGFVFITGESGSGKTTLMNIMTGLDVPTCGEIIYDQLSDWDKIRNNKIGIIFQNNNIFEELTVYENLCLVLRMINIPVQSYSDIIKNALKFVGLSGYEKRKCNQLSAGQKQRVSIARVIIKNPCVIFADEPTGNLDSETAEQILDLLNKISKKCLVIMISHDRESAFRYADRIISLKKGQIVEDISNAKRKILYDKDYYIKGEKQACIKYKDFSLTDYISNHLLTNQSFVHRIDLELVAHHDMETQKNDILYQHYSEKNFSIYDFIWMIQSHVYYNRTKILLGILLVSFICSIFFAFFSFINNDYIHASAVYTNKTKQIFVPLYGVAEDETFVNSGKMLDLAVHKIYQPGDYFKEKSGCEIIYSGKSLEVSILFNEVDQNPGITLKCGDWVSRPNDIVLSTTTVDMLNAEVGDWIEYEENKYFICGIADVENNIGVVSYLSITNQLNYSSFSFVGDNVIAAPDIDLFSNDSKLIGYYDIESINNNAFVFGRPPLKNDEVAISKQLAEEYYQWPEKNIPRNIRLPNLFSNEYGFRYSDALNLCDYTGRNVRIVGIYDEDIVDTGAKLLYTKQVFDFALKDYFTYINYKAIWVLNNDFLVQHIHDLSAEKIYINSPICKQIMYKWKYGIANVKNILYIILIFLAIVVFIACIFVLGIRIKEHQTNIGIYRALGMPVKDIILCYSVENCMIVLIINVFSTIFTFLILKMIERMILMLNQIKVIYIFDYSLNNILLFYMMMMFFGMIVTIVPLMKYKKKQPISLITGTK